VSGFEGREGKEKRERLFSSTGSGEDLGGEKPQESTGSRPGLILRGAQKGLGFFGGRKSLKHPGKAGGFFPQVQEGWGLGKPGLDHGRGGKLWRGNPRSVGG
jgi:hypothetical protein